MTIAKIRWTFNDIVTATDIPVEEIKSATFSTSDVTNAGRYARSARADVGMYNRAIPEIERK